MKDTVIKVTNLTKKFGYITAVDSISFEVKKGQILGIVGPNGSGKTTTLSMLLSLLKPNTGTIELFGSLDLCKGRKRIGATLESGGFYPDFSAEKNLKIVALIKNADFTQIHELLNKVGLWERRKHIYSNYSFGMKQRLSIASALLGNPEVILLDEPTNGLDARGIIEVRELIKELGNQGKTVIVASHLLSEIEKIATFIAVMHKGKITKLAELKELTDKYTTLENAFIELTN